MMYLRFRNLSLLVFCFFITAALFGAEWPPVLEKTDVINDRITDRYQHGQLPEWEGADPDQKDEFVVIHPKVPELVNAEGRPLYVVLHSAGHALDSTLVCQGEKGNHDIYHAPDDFYALVLDCYANRDTDWWWGGLRDEEELNDQNRAKAEPGLSPCEKRVIDTVLWTIAHYKIDVNRVYLCGNSMGGSGTLGIGLRHGNIFAAVKANVPAGCRHAACRLCFGQDFPAGISIPEPPVCVDYSGSNDEWSRDHAVLIDGMHDRKYPLLLFWGPFGHENNHEKIEKVNDLPNRFAWTEIRKNEVYPVFTEASTDTVSPWPDPVERCPVSAPAGQINGFFRWELQNDTPESLAVTLRLADADELHSKIFTVPTESTVDVSFRRIQEFRVRPYEILDWSFGNLSGKVKADKNGLVTIPHLIIKTKPQTVTLTRKQN